MNYRKYRISYTIHILDLYFGGYLRMISYEPLFRTMKEKGISSYRLGKMGFPMSNYYAIKRGENISSHTLNQLCRLLQCRVEDVMEYVENEPEP